MSQDHIEKKEIQVLNFNEIDNNDDDDDEIVHIKITPKIDIKIKYSKLLIKSKLVQNKYRVNDMDRLSNDLQQYQQKHNIKNENILSFFKCIDDEKNNIIIEEYFDYLILNQMFHITNMNKYLKAFAQKYVNDVSFIIFKIKYHLSSHDDFMPLMEKTLSENINACLKNENFCQLPDHIIHRIISNNFKITPGNIDDNLLFNFINGSIKQRSIFFSKCTKSF